jgi:membrane-bound lytic murein transglycosylase A
LVQERDRLVLEEWAFADLPGWRKDSHAEVLTAFVKSCDLIRNQRDGRSFGGKRIAGEVVDWRAICAEAASIQELEPGNNATARAFFEKWFSPFRATNNGNPTGLFTGYYEPILRGSRTRSGTYSFPLYRRPKSLVTVDLGLFYDDLRGRRIIGKVQDGKVKPFDDRASINAGALDGQDLEIVWVDDPVDAFFLHIQGSGLVVLDDGSVLRLGYAAQNGRAYRSVGRELIHRRILKREDVSLEAIQAWMRTNPRRGQALMEKNPSYIFFRELDGDGPIGAQEVALTALRSLAVDRRFIPLGVPIWLDTTVPSNNRREPPRPMQRLFIAQDTGGAIRGPVRGDIYWGTGPGPGAVAGRMKYDGEYFLLLPRFLDRGRLPLM